MRAGKLFPLRSKRPSWAERLETRGSRRIRKKTRKMQAQVARGERNHRPLQLNLTRRAHRNLCLARGISKMIRPILKSLSLMMRGQEIKRTLMMKAKKSKMIRREVKMENQRLMMFLQKTEDPRKLSSRLVLLRRIKLKSKRRGTRSSWIKRRTSARSSRWSRRRPPPKTRKKHRSRTSLHTTSGRGTRFRKNQKRQSRNCSGRTNYTRARRSAVGVSCIWKASMNRL